jgi:hypothetical protein
MCAACATTKAASQFDAKELQCLSEQSKIHEAVCLECAPKHRDRAARQVVSCMICKESKELSQYSIPMQKKAVTRNYVTMRCEDCQAPPCSECGQRPTGSLNAYVAPKTVEEKGAYRCEACLYKPCQGCGVQPTKRQRNLHRGAAWTCRKCFETEKASA